MGKAKKKNRARRTGGANTAGNMHPVLKQAISNGARLDRGSYEVAEVQNPYGEVIIRGEIRRHKAVRRVPRFETLYRSKVIDRTVFACLEWYADRLAMAQSGLIKCGLDVSGSGGGSAFHHIPTTQAAMEARSDVDWARGFIPDNDLRQVFDGVMGSMDAEGDDTFEAIGAAVYPHVCSDRAKRKASSAFKIAANYLLAGIGARVVGLADAA
ncbi:hypothetical protein [Erythrobacter sp. CCH5-A1]|jgi:hypothetical protein|uniref:hypothetical protein n=1 Tax=Erythrobacter sp. CCH5-A1 TaxID=1768792 RepID=UPI0008376640|nr:hypothetical protein [Erythrobacter sp. CCH5-A1]